jgi:4-amino-4-deoxy-L-arabinose transferase-like glycosyltransferase
MIFTAVTAVTTPELEVPEVHVERSARRTPARLALPALVLVTALAAALRLWSLSRVPLDPFYDAAVRSMGLSWHNFFFGAYEPGGSVSIDKPPVDLWFQVASVKLFGFGSTQLKLPEALAGTLAVPLLYDAVRRVFGHLAGIASALALAVLPVAVLTARSDTMDSVMMLITVIAFWMLVRYASENRSRWLYIAAAAMGIAFTVKLFQGLVGLPALLLVAFLAGRERRWRRLAVSAAVFLGVSLSWLTLTLFASNPPFAIGSTNGSAWNAAFVFNGWDRIAKPATQADLGASEGTTATAPAGNTEPQRSAVPINKPSPTRLFARNGPLSGLRLGYLLLGALLLGIPALLYSVIRPRAPSERAVAAGLLLWLITGLLLFTVMARLHPRYTEGFTPAVAAAAGIGIAWVASGSRRRALLAALAAVALVLYGRHIRDDATTIFTLTAIAGALTVAACFLPTRLRRAGVASTVALTLLILPLHVSVVLVQHAESDGGRVGYMTPAAVSAFSDYLKAHNAGAHYEFATGAATQAAALIVHDAQPVLVLTSFEGRPLVGPAKLAALVRAGQVRYAMLGGGCSRRRPSPTIASCSPAAFWVRAHGTDVSRQAGLPRPGLLWRL